MSNYLLKITGRSILFYKKDYFNQLIIIALLASIISGSLFTGYSVRASLKKNSIEKLGNTSILVSSGLRFFDSSLSEKLSSVYSVKNTSVLETYGYCQNFATGATALNINIYGIKDDFFSFHGVSDISLPHGSVLINSRLASQIGVKPGDEIIIRFRDSDPIPANAPFAPSKEADASRVLVVAAVLESIQAGNFSLGISQLTPQNIFISLSDLQPENSSSYKVNRMLLEETDDLVVPQVYDKIKELLVPTDIGLSLRISEVTGEQEIISDRVFIDSALTGIILNRIPAGYPLITYLANRIGTERSETPYSFIAGLPPESGLEIKDDEIIINRWLADDIGAGKGDDISISWYDPDGNMLTEKDINFVIGSVTENNSSFSDPAFMPEFPGISGSSTCSSWDAGIPILMSRIRDKDEAYWNEYKGTPKAFINYKTARTLWGNNFGPATAIRFPVPIESEEILNSLKGSIDPAGAGFTVTDIRDSGKAAASESVDFSTLFLSLGFFILVSCFILLSFSVSIFFDSKKEMVRTYYSLGFRNSTIGRLLFFEISFVSLVGAAAGAFLGYGVNLLLITALNSVWSGAVQTNTLMAQFSLLPVIIGFLATLVITGLLITLKLRKFLIVLAGAGKNSINHESGRKNLIFLILTSFSAITVTVISMVMKDPPIIISFAGGTLIFISLILALRHYYQLKPGLSTGRQYSHFRFAKRYYSFYPAQAITPVIFIAAGIFAIIITGANRQVLDEKMLLNEGGTGGFQLWAESAIPVKENLNSSEARKEFGLDETGLPEIEILEGRKLPGDDASCLNLNHIKAPPLLGLDPTELINRGSFSFVSVIAGTTGKNPWSLLNETGEDDVIYGIADQTVLKWGLKISVGDTLIFRSENGKNLKIIIGAGLRSSLFQGHLLIGDKNFRKYFPSVPGSSVFLIDSKTDDPELIMDLLTERLSAYGFSTEPAGEKLASFFVVTNTYLNVFTILGVLGLFLGVAGMGFTLLRNFNQRKGEFALMMATGYSPAQLRKFILGDQVIILIAGIVTGSISAIVATLPTLLEGNGIPVKLIIIMVAALFITGITVLFTAVGKIGSSNLLMQLRKE
jgi:ABC-type antimicrobial peptide transport system permease subunit